jgi:hypothetical protein
MHYAPPRMRFELLRALYMHADQHPGQAFSESAIADEFAVSPLQFDMVVDWLEVHGFVGVAEGGALAITPAGVAEIEARGSRWRAEVEAIAAWLELEKARIAEASVGAVSREIALRKGAVVEARRRRQAVETRMRDMSGPWTDD